MKKFTLGELKKEMETISKSWHKSIAKGDKVYDPFLGTGTTAVVAKKMKRKFIGSEILKDYYKIAKRKLNEVGNLI